jgi:hypothetical protein
MNDKTTIRGTMLTADCGDRIHVRARSPAQRCRVTPEECEVTLPAGRCARVHDRGMASRRCILN